MRKKLLVLLIMLLSASILSNICSAIETPPSIDEKILKDLWSDFSSDSYSLYDVNTGQNYHPLVIFDSDSNGVPYADGKSFYYINYGKGFGDEYFIGAYQKTYELFKKCMTPELAERMTKNFQVPGGPDVEFIRRDSDGNWYRLFLIRPFGFIHEVKSIESDGAKAQAKFRTDIIIIDLNYRDRGFNEPMALHVTTDCTVDLVYTADGWRMSGGDIFDYICDYAASSPSPETGDDNGVRAAWLGAAAVLAAAIPAVMLTVSRRKKKYNDI